MRRFSPELRRLIAALLAGLTMTGCRAHSFFYLPNRVLYADPDKLHLDYELIRYPSLDGKTIVALYFKTPSETPLGTVVHFHGNYANVSNHFPQSYFFTRHGFDVVVFDYQGYGGSEGKPTPRRTVEDGIASIRWAYDHRRNPSGGVVVFGQSLGAAVAAVAVAKEPLARAVVLESPFATYRSMARAVLGRTMILWPLYPFFPLFLGSTYDPARWIGKISPRPVLIVHGDADRIVPVRMSRVLFERAKEPKKLLIIPGADHLQCRAKGGVAYETQLVEFFTDALAPSNKR